MNQLCLILNPEAGSAKVDSAVISELRSSTALEVLRTGAPGDAAMLAARALDDGHRRIAVAGGDGTLNEVVNGLGERLAEVELAVIPMGTGNDLARCPGVPGNVDEALPAIREWRTRRMDVGRIVREEDSRLFLNVLTGGFSTRVTAEVERDDKVAWGALAYAVSAARALPDLQPHVVAVEFDDGQERVEIDCLNLVVANGRHVGGGLNVAPDARLDDGLLEVVLVPEMPVPRLALLLSRLVAGDPTEEPELEVRRARRLRIEAEPAIRLTADGEPALETPVTVDLLAGALRLVTTGRPESDPGL